MEETMDPALLISKFKPDIWAIASQADVEALAAGMLAAAGTRVELAAGRDQDVEVRISGQARAAQPLYTVDERGVGIIPVKGVLAYDANRDHGEISYDSIVQAVQESERDPAVLVRVLDFDTPGGTVAGVQIAGHAIALSSQVKPIYAYTGNLMASAGYWLASQAMGIGAAETAAVGSIGVIMVHMDMSKMLEMFGLKVTAIAAGEMKAAGAPWSPLSDRDRAYFQSRAETTREIFVDNVAKGRGVSVEKALEMAGEAAIFLGAEAKERGLIDIMSSRDEFISQIAKEARSMDVKTLKAEHPEVVQALRAEHTEGLVPAAEVDAGVEAERARLMDLAQAVFGEDAATGFAKVAEAQTVSDAMKAMADAGLLFSINLTKPPEVEDAEPAPTRAKILEGVQAASPPPAQGSAPKGGDEPKAEEYEAILAAYAAEHDCSKAEAMKAIEAIHPGLREKYVEQSNKKGGAK
jgi:signal peptide peptidase SppA